MTPPLHITYDWLPIGSRGITPGVSVILPAAVTIAAAWTEILSRHITTRGASSAISILASWSGSQRTADGGVPRFRILVDGSVVAIGISGPTSQVQRYSSGIFPHLEAVVAGRHIVSLEVFDTIASYVIDPTLSPSTTPVGPGLGLFQAHLFAREVQGS